MKNNVRHFASLIVLMLVPAVNQQAFAMSSGITGYSGNPNNCSACHSGGIVPTVTLVGPTVVPPGTINDFTLTISGGQSNSGGLDISAGSGTLINKQSNTRLQNGEIVHVTRATAGTGGSISWTFSWQAPTTTGSYNIYSAGLSTNGNGNTTGDGVATLITPISVSNAAPQPPTAVIQSPATAQVGVTVSFSGAGSYDPDGTINQYEWNFGDGNTALGAQAINTFMTAGVYTVTLRVTDNTGLSHTTFRDIQIGGTQLPSANAGGPYTGTAGQAVNFDASQTTHVSAITRYIWDFGDGTPLVTSTVPTISHTYAQLGSYVVTLAAQDTNNMTGVAIATVVISAVPPPPPPPVTDGATLYANNCSSCHGPLASSTKLNRTATQIQNAINANTGGMGAFSNLTSTQVSAIAAALVNTTPPPPVTDGATLYANNCETCHGPLATSSKLNRTASQITAAISANTGGMGGLTGLSVSQVQAIADALVNVTPPPPANDGATLYTNNCASCHGALASSTKLNRTATQITNAILNNTGGMGGFNNLSLTQIQLIADALYTATPPPPVTDGATLYTNNCSNCHGPLATSSKLNRTATQIQNAINSNTGGMGGLSSLTSTQVSAIASALVTTTPPPPATDGAVLYGQYCQSCHGTLASSTKLNRTANQISSAITSVSQMNSINLTTTQISAIASALASVTPVPTTGEGLYNTYCAACHGTGGRGGQYEGVTGESASSITSAIREEELMRSISLTSNQISLISDYLNGRNSGGGTTPPPTTDGPTLYGQYCQSCHGPLASSTKLNRTATQITNAISTVGQMNSINLTSTQITAIANALTSTTTPPPSTDGAALYGTYCQSCHGSLATSSKLNRTATQITNAIATVGTMNSISLTSTQIQAIATALGSVTPAPTTGEGLYNTYCSSCHGAEGRGGTYGSVRGASVSEISGAISGEQLMRSITLTSSQKQAIASYLSGSTYSGGSYSGGEHD